MSTVALIAFGEKYSEAIKTNRFETRRSSK